MRRGTGWIMENSWSRGKISLTAKNKPSTGRCKAHPTPEIQDEQKKQAEQSMFARVLGAIAVSRQAITHTPFWRKQYQGRHR